MNNTKSCFGKDIFKHKCRPFNKSTGLKDLLLLHDRSSISLWKDYMELKKNTWGCKGMHDCLKLWLIRRPAIEKKKQALLELERRRFEEEERPLHEIQV